MNSAQRCQSQRRAYKLTRRYRETVGSYSPIVGEFGAIGAGHQLGPRPVHDKRIAETLAALAAGAPLGTKLRADLERAAAKPATFIQWVRRQHKNKSGLIRAILKATKSPITNAHP